MLKKRQQQCRSLEGSFKFLRHYWGGMFRLVLVLLPFTSPSFVCADRQLSARHPGALPALQSCDTTFDDLNHLGCSGGFAETPVNRSCFDVSTAADCRAVPLAVPPATAVGSR